MEQAKRKRLLRVILLFGCALVILIGYLVVWRLTGLGIPCTFYEKTGLLCPGCGITRAGFALLCLDIPTALSHHPLILLIVAYVGWYVGVGCYRYVTGKGDPWDLRPYWIHILFLAVLAVFSVVRNL